MKLSSKMKMAFIIMAILPLILSGIAISYTISKETQKLRDKYNLSEDYKMSDLYSQGALLYGVSESNYNKVEQAIRGNEKALDNISFYSGLGSILEENMSHLVVMKNNTIIYSSADLSDNEIKEIVSDNVISYNSEKRSFLVSGEEECIIKVFSYTVGVNNHYRAYIITPLYQDFPQFRALLLEMFLIILGIMACTSFILYFWVHHSFVHPVMRLKLGTQNIKNGNLDFEFPSDEDGELGELCQDFEDMRLRLYKSAEEKIKSDTEEKELIRNISHDLKTPLTAIKGYVEGLRDGIANTPEKQQKYILTIANKVSDMDRLIEELTLFSRLDTNRIPYDFIKINVKYYFDDCIEELKIDLDAQNIRLDYNFNAGDDFIVMADPSQMKRVINNIISNSIKYKSPARPCEIKVSVFDEGDYIHIEMSDNGKGIAMKDLPHIFDRFYRTDESRTSPQSGSGIGLAIVKKIIEDHKGRIWVDSVEGEGTIFHINLLRYKEEEKAETQDSDIKLVKQGKRRKS